MISLPSLSFVISFSFLFVLFLVLSFAFLSFVLVGCPGGGGNREGGGKLFCGGRGAGAGAGAGAEFVWGGSVFFASGRDFFRGRCLRERRGECGFFWSGVFWEGGGLFVEGELVNSDLFLGSQRFRQTISVTRFLVF